MDAVVSPPTLSVAASNTTETSFLVSQYSRFLAVSVKAMHRRRQAAAAIVAVFALLWLIAVPAVVAYVEGWTYTAGLYYSIQAGVGVGFGALQVRHVAMIWLMSFQCLFGTVLVTVVAAILLARMLARTERRAAAAAAVSPASVDLGLPSVPWVGLAISTTLVLLLIVSGIVYGMVYEHWSFARSLLFIVSLLQTSGLEAPSIGPGSGAWPCLFVAALCLVGVPLWAFVIGSAASYIAQRASRHHALLEALRRERSAEATFARRHAHLNLAVDSLIDRQTFLELWLLRNGLVTEETMRAVDAEYGRMTADGEGLTLGCLVQQLQRIQMQQLGCDCETIAATVGVAAGGSSGPACRTATRGSGLRSGGGDGSA